MSAAEWYAAHPCDKPGTCDGQVDVPSDIKRLRARLGVGDCLVETIGPALTHLVHAVGVCASRCLFYLQKKAPKAS